MRSDKKALNIWLEAQEQCLEGSDLLRNLTRSAAVCNGIGAEWFPGWLRWAVTELHPTLEATSWIHDLDYDTGGGIVARWKADARFFINGIRAATEIYPVWRPARYIVIKDTIIFWLILRLGGQAAFTWKKKDKTS